MRTEIEITASEIEELINQKTKPHTLFGEQFSDKTESADKHILLVHGWNSDSGAMGKIYQELKKAPEATNFKFWRVDYDWNRAFPFGASQVKESIIENNIPLDRTIIFCYSMGGVVMRKVLSDGFPFYSLVSVCSPHEGMLLFADEGSLSLQYNSQDLYNLNHNAKDKLNRNKFSFYGISHTNPAGYHAGDSIVSLDSAMGNNLHPSRSGEMNVKYPSVHNPFEPHSLGMEPRFIKLALDRCKELMKQLI